MIAPVHHVGIRFVCTRCEEAWNDLTIKPSRCPHCGRFCARATVGEMRPYIMTCGSVGSLEP